MLFKELLVLCVKQWMPSLKLHVALLRKPLRTWQQEHLRLAEHLSQFGHQDTIVARTHPLVSAL